MQLRKPPGKRHRGREQVAFNRNGVVQDQDTYATRAFHLVPISDTDPPHRHARRFVAARSSAIAVRQHFLAGGSAADAPLLSKGGDVADTVAVSRAAKRRWDLVRKYFLRSLQDPLTLAIRALTGRSGLVITQQDIERFRAKALKKEFQPSSILAMRTRDAKHMPVPTYTNARERSHAVAALQWLPPFHPPRDLPEYEWEMPYLSASRRHFDVMTGTAIPQHRPKFSWEGMLGALDSRNEAVLLAKRGKYSGPSMVIEDLFPPITMNEKKKEHRSIAMTQQLRRRRRKSSLSSVGGALESSDAGETSEGSVDNHRLWASEDVMQTVWKSMSASETNRNMEGSPPVAEGSPPVTESDVRRDRRAVSFAPAASGTFLTSLPPIRAESEPPGRRVDRDLELRLKRFEADCPDVRSIEKDLLFHTDIDNIVDQDRKRSKSKFRKWRLGDETSEANSVSKLEQRLLLRERERFRANSSTAIYDKSLELTMGEAQFQKHVKSPLRRTSRPVWLQARMECAHDSGLVARRDLYDRLRAFVTDEGGVKSRAHEAFLYRVKIELQKTSTVLDEGLFWCLVEHAGVQGMQDVGVVRTIHFFRYVLGPPIPLDDLVAFCDERDWDSVVTVPSLLEGFPWIEPHLRVEKGVMEAEQRKKDLAASVASARRLARLRRSSVSSTATSATPGKRRMRLSLAAVQAAAEMEQDYTVKKERNKTVKW